MILNLKATLYFLAGIILLASSGELIRSASAKPAFDYSLKKHTTKKEEPRVDIPLWVDDPRFVHHIGAVGTAPKQKFSGEEAQTWVAIEDAQVNLNLNYLKQQRELMLKHEKLLPLEHESNMDLSVRKLLLHNAIVRDEWIDPQTGTLYLWLVLPISDIQFNNNQEE